MAWSSLFLPSPDAAASVEALRESLTSLGYTLFDPFGSLPGKSYPRAVRLFVAPAQDGWARAIGEPDARQLPILSRSGLALHTALDGGAARIAVYANGEDAGVEALAPFLRPGLSVDDLRRAALSVMSAKGDDGNGLPFAALPGDVQAMAGKVNPKQAQSMFARMAGMAAKRAGQDPAMAESARQLVASGSGPDWNSAGGQQIRALLRCLTIPEGWQTPDFVTLRDAYQLHARKRRSPNAQLYPGDAEAMATVLDALAYTSVYAGADA